MVAAEAAVVVAAAAAAVLVAAATAIVVAAVLVMAAVAALQGSESCGCAYAPAGTGHSSVKSGANSPGRKLS